MKILKYPTKKIIQAIMKDVDLSQEEKKKIWVDYKKFNLLKKEKGEEVAIKSLPEDSVLRKLFSRLYLKKAER